MLVTIVNVHVGFVPRFKIGPVYRDDPMNNKCINTRTMRRTQSQYHLFPKMLPIAFSKKRGIITIVVYRSCEHASPCKLSWQGT